MAFRAAGDIIRVDFFRRIKMDMIKRALALLLAVASLPRGMCRIFWI